MNLGIYIQVPFCQTKCTYCNFHTGVAPRAAYAPYARAVEREIRDWRAMFATAHLESAASLESAFVDTIYLGGGTPSLFDPADLARILEAVRSQFGEPDATSGSSGARAASTRAASTADVAGRSEVTLEADPETITRSEERRVGKEWREAG